MQGVYEETNAWHPIYIVAQSTNLSSSLAILLVAEDLQAKTAMRKVCRSRTGFPGGSGIGRAEFFLLGFCGIPPEFFFPAGPPTGADLLIFGAGFCGCKPRDRNQR